EHLSGREVLHYLAKLKGHNKAQADKLLEEVNLSAAADRAVKTYSKGMRQRLGLAQAFLGEPKLLILDEPTNGLDPTQTEHMRDLIRGIAQHATVILSTHIMQEVDALCDRALILRNGKLAVDEKLSALRHSNHLLVQTNLNEDKLCAKLLALPVVSQCDAIKDALSSHHFHYRITLTEDGESAAQANALVAKTIIEAGGELYQLETEHRDLETLFREVKQHAA
ncbi:MAG: ABC transporter ATP-binding protein, partial [Pseudomonadales bacterium]|nr:ABC transporter ATP-binding protein [Pseudomonadales bacterium]